MLDPKEDEWELHNDDGFVYKRLRRTDPPPEPVFPAIEPPENRRLRKKRTLLRLREQYSAEIEQWEDLSAKLKEMEEKSQKLCQRHRRTRESTPPEFSAAPSGNVFRPVIDELLFQAEAQESILKDLSNLCDAADAMCEMHEEQLKQSFIDLPIWASPLALMASFSELEDKDG